ncbi:MAG TPA: oligoendopeptidase F [Casimicrobiaceae bacterium]|jgi:oligoendopeptidase F|nr:oligoendopeptidase F [Casimicrobiaceae bacterium]
MISRLALFLYGAALVNPASAESVADTWNLADLYPSVAAWNADADKLTSQMAEMAKCKGHLGDSAATFKQCLGLQADIDKRFARLAVYGFESYSADTGSAGNVELRQKVELLDSKVNEAQAFVRPEILRVGSDRVDRFLAEDKTLAIYRHPLDEILRAAPHTLDDEGEALIAQFGLTQGAGASAYSILTNADIPWPTIKLSTGEEVKLDDSAYTQYREVPNRDDRKRVMDAFFGTYKTYEQTLGVTLYSQLKEDAVLAKVRKYPDSITRTLDRNRIPIAVMDTLIAQTNANLATLHRYFRLRAKMLGVPQLHYYDIYPPLVKSDIKFPLATAKQLVLEAVAPLGPDYVAAMAKGFDSRWMDAYPRPKKQSGAHMAGDAYDIHPYVLANYTDNYESVTTVAHEWGHAMHTWLADHAQPYVTSDYPIFIAEIASTFNENLLLQRVLKTAKTDDERLLYLGSALEGLRGTFFRQAMFAEFERSVHARVDAGEPMSGEAFTKAYCDILKRYHGASEGVVAIDDAYCVEWAYIPHFYSEFYVYQYATSIAASSLFVQKVGAGEPGALKRYLDLLRAGGSDYPYDLVKAAGVDLATPAPYQAIVARMSSIMDQIEAILAQRK